MDTWENQGEVFVNTQKNKTENLQFMNKNDRDLKYDILGKTAKENNSSTIHHVSIWM